MPAPPTRLVQPENILLPFVDFFVIQSLPTDIVCRLEQSWNMDVMFVTLTVLKLLTSRLVRLEQPENIAIMFVTLDVTRLEPSNVVRLENPSNQYAVLVSVVHSANEASNTTLVILLLTSFHPLSVIELNDLTSKASSPLFLL